MEKPVSITTGTMLLISRHKENGTKALGALLLLINEKKFDSYDLWTICARGETQEVMAELRTRGEGGGCRMAELVEGTRDTHLYAEGIKLRESN